MRMFAALLCLSMMTAAPAFAQFETASVVGTIRDASGAVIPGAKVTLTNTATNVSLTRTSTAEGTYEFVTVKSGIYLITAETPGFALAFVENVQVQVGARLRVDLQLAVGQLSERVEVAAVSPLIETDSSQRGQVITGDQIRELALNGREYSSLALLATGVRQSALNKSPNGTPREGAFNVNGLRSTFNNFLIDGVDNNAYGTSNQGFSNQVMQPPPDAVGEFRVVTNNQSAEYGRAAGATVNVAYRSGANQFHGDAWEFFRDTRLNATTFFVPADGQKPPLRRNQYGGVLGGPIVKNKAFFFGDFEGFRQNRKSTAFSTLPTAAQDAGILTVDIRDPRSGVVYPAGTPIPMTAFARKVLSGLPAPNLPGNANNYSILQAFTNKTDKAGGKIDLQLNPNVSMFGRFGWRDLSTNDQAPIPLPSGGGGNGNIYARNKQFVFGTTYVASDRSLLEVRLGWSNTKGGKNPPALGSSDTFGITGLPTDARIAGGLPSQSVGGLSAFGRQATNPQWQYPTVWNPKINYSSLLGRHSVKAGYEFQKIDVEVQDVNPLYGLDTYTGQFTKPVATLAANNLYNLADFMFGLRSQYALSTFYIAQMRQQLHFTYIQDDVRIGNKLTLNAGLRYEYATPMWEANNALTNFDPATRTMIKAKDGSVADRGLVDPDRNNFGPRLGFAYQLAPATVVRGGWGMSYVHINRIGSANLLGINGPQVVRAAVVQGDATAPTFRPTEQGYPAGLTDPSTFNPLAALVSYIPKDFHSSPVQSWHVSFQKEFLSGMLLDVAYVGNKADDLLLVANYNQAVPNSPTANIPLAARRPISTFGDITYNFNGGKSRYQAFQSKFEWRMGSDVTLLSSLTLSRAKDNSAGALENQNGNFPAPQDLHNLDADFGLGAYHQPYNTTTSFIVSLPFGHGKRWGANLPPALDVLAGGWQLAGINTVTPGEMVTFTYTPVAAFIVSAITNDFSGANNYRPNITCDPYAAAGQSITQWFNPSCVVIPTDQSQPFGNAPRNNVRGPNFWQFDLAASKNVALGGQARLQLRLEAFNLFNRTNFTPPAANRSNSTFGTITGTFEQRQLQLGVKVLW
jgi:Carboxypeptidase regulatory-like domain/TonB-dependent Receptor Plug Domain/TonB dependent receptor-like, beta-barrel